MTVTRVDQASRFLPRSSVPERLSGFFHALRENGFSPGIAEVIDASRAFASVPIDDLQALRDSLKALVSHNADEWRKFDKVFDAYWFAKSRLQTRVIGGISGFAGRPEQVGSGGGERSGLPSMLEGGSGGAAASGGEKGSGASSAESLSDVDLRHIADPEQLRKAHAIAADLARRMKHRLSRRQRFARRGRRLDLRRVIHRNIQHGGLPLDLIYRKPRPKPWKLVVLLDVSGSMNLYSTVFLRFVHGIVEHFRDAEAFVFHTRLVHIAGAMRDPNPMLAMDRLAVMASGWSGGTRIGESLATFNRNYAPTILGSRSVVLILSDGLDTGKPELLGCELAAIKRRAKLLIWLNPLIGWQGYEPKAAAMAAALPHIDLFAPAHNLKSLMALESVLPRY